MAVSTINEAGLGIQAYGNRNLIINGAMQVAQRGTGFTDVANSSYSVDRWVTEYTEANFELDFEQISGSAPKGFQYSLKATSQDTHTATAAQYIIPFEQRIEKNVIDQIGWGNSDAQEFTLSFWIKSNRTGTNTVNLNLAVPTGGTDDATARQYTISAADTWEYKTITFPANTTTYSGETNLSNRGLTLFWWMIAGSSYTSGSIPTGWENETQANRAVGCSDVTTIGDYWQITGVQLEVGDTATPFEHRSYGDELARCQRYYYQDDTTSHFLRSQNVAATGDWYTDYPLPVSMRTTPTWTAQLGSDVSRVNAVTISGRTNKSGYVRFTVNGGGQGYHSFNTVTADAEL